MPNTPKHTPLPWSLVTQLHHGTILGNSIPRITIANVSMRSVEEKANAAHIVRCVNEREELLAALKGLLAEVPLHKLNVRKDFSLMNAHAYANKVLHNAEKES